MLERKFNVELVESIGNEGMRQAWITSKPTLTYKDEADLQSYLDNVINNDLPLTGFHNYCLKIGSSILFRDLMLTLRPIQVWATSSRIVKIENLGLETNYSVSEKTKSDYDKVVELQSTGDSLDHSKRWCPLQQYTEFTCVLDLRTIAVFCKTIYECDIELFNSHCVPIIEAIGFTPERILKIKSKSIYDKLSVPDDVQANICNDEGVRYQETDTSYELGVEVAFALGAQFIRQHYARVRSSIWNELKEVGYKCMLDNFNSASKFFYTSVGEKEQWKQVVSRRTCWVAQFDWDDEFGWAFILNKFLKKYSFEEFCNNLPCRGDGFNCNIFNETKLRLFSNRPESEAWEGNVPDENPCCPLLIQDRSMMDKRIKMYGSNSFITDRWKQLVGRIKDNPNNAARLFYECKSEDCPNDTSYLHK